MILQNSRQPQLKDNSREKVTSKMSFADMHLYENLYLNIHLILRKPQWVEADQRKNHLLDRRFFQAFHKCTRLILLESTEWS